MRIGKRHLSKGKWIRVGIASLTSEVCMRHSRENVVRIQALYGVRTLSNK